MPYFTYLRSLETYLETLSEGVSDGVSYGYTYGYAQRGILGVWEHIWCPIYPMGVHRWPDTLSEGVRIGSTCGNAGVSSYSRVVF